MYGFHLHVSSLPGTQLDRRRAPGIRTAGRGPGRHKLFPLSGSGLGIVGKHVAALRLPGGPVLMSEESNHVGCPSG